jgi:hypothetical protein
LTDDERMHRASRAQEVLGNEAFAAALDALAGTYIEAWRKARTVEAREDAHRYVMLCERLETDLQAMILDGQLTAKRVKELEGRKPWTLGR